MVTVLERAPWHTASAAFPLCNVLLSMASCDARGACPGLWAVRSWEHPHTGEWRPAVLVGSVFSDVLKGSQGVEKVYRCRLSCLGNVCWHFTDNSLLCLGCTRLDKCCVVQCCCVSLWVSGCPVLSTDRDLCVVGPAVRQGSTSGCRTSCPDPLCRHSLSQGTLPYHTVVIQVSGVPPGHLGWVCLLNFIICLLWFSPAFKAHEEEVRKKFRPIEQLKEEFEKLNVKMETDYEIMDKLISKFNSSASTLDEKVAALYDLEYYVHQVTKTHLYLPCKIQGLRYHKCGFIFLISIR